MDFYYNKYKSGLEETIYISLTSACLLKDWILLKNTVFEFDVTTPDVKFYENV